MGTYLQFKKWKWEYQESEVTLGYNSELKASLNDMRPYHRTKSPENAWTSL